MSAFSVRIYDRNGNAVAPPAEVTLTPQQWEAAALGGPVAAEIDASGSIHGLLGLASWLAYEVRIASDGAEVWWGEIDTVRVVAGGLERAATLDGMANRVKVLYTAALAGGELASAETEWAEDATSVAAYGRRELVHSASGTLTETQALALRTRLLAGLSSPQKRLRFAGNAEVSGKITCRGLWPRLGDVYYRQAAGLEAHAPDGGEAIPLGLGFSSAYLAFVGSNGAKVIQEIYGHFAHFGNYSGLKFIVAGTSSNNGVRTVASGDRREATTYASNQIHFAVADDMYDGGDGLSFLATNDVILVSGADQEGNNGIRMVKTTGSGHIEVSPGWNAGFVDSGGMGPTVTIQRGNGVTIEETVTSEAPNGVVSETVTAYGQRIYQQFALAAPIEWTLATVEVRVRRVGSPADNLRVGLYADAAGTPGALLEAATLAGSALLEEVDWVALEFSNTVLLNDGVTYGLLIERTGAMDPDNFYEVEIDPEGGYARGAMRLHDGSAYQAATGSLIFRCLGAVDTATQVQEVVSGAGIGIDNVLAEIVSGLEAHQYRGEDETALAVVKGLLDQGTAAGGRLLATVVQGWLVRIFEQATALQRLWVWREGTLQQATGAPALAGWLPAGQWVHLDDVLLSGAWQGMSPLFVERASYQVGRGWNLEAENQDGLAGLLGVQQG